LRNRLARPLPQLHGRTPYEIISGNTPDISEFLEYEWYQPVWYYEPSTFPEQEKHLARWIGIAHRVGQAMCYWLLPKSGIPIARTTIQAISEMELSQDNIKEQLKDYDEVIRQKLSTENDLSSYIQLYREDCENDLIDDKELPESKEVDSIEPDMYDELLMTQPMLIRDGRMEHATIIGRKRDNDGNLIGKYDANPLSNTRVYLAEFPDGLIAEYSANTVVKAIYNDVNDDGYNEAFLVDIIGHERTNEAITNMEADQNTRHTTKGWNICLSWDDGSTSWHTLSDVKNSYTTQLAEYALMNNLQNEPAFKWWVKPTIRRKKRILKATKTRYAKRTHKFGIKVPQTVEEALQIDVDTKTTFWHDTIKKEMINNRAAFKFLEEDENVPVGYKWIRCHMIFDVKMDFTWKARFVAGVDMTDPPSSITYSSVVSRDSVRIAFMLA